MLAAQPVSNSVLDQCTEGDAVGRRGGPPHADVLRRAHILKERDQYILQVVLTGQHSMREVAKMAGQSPGTLSRRVARLMRLLREPIVAALADFPQQLGESYREVGRRRFVLGQGITAIGRDLGYSRGEIQSMCSYLQAWAMLRRCA